MSSEEPVICALPGCDEVVEQPLDGGTRRLYHSRECRIAARRLRAGEKTIAAAEPAAEQETPGNSEEPASPPPPRPRRKVLAGAGALAVVAAVVLVVTLLTGDGSPGPRDNAAPAAVPPPAATVTSMVTVTSSPEATPGSPAGSPTGESVQPVVNVSTVSPTGHPSSHTPAAGSPPPAARPPAGQSGQGPQQAATSSVQYGFESGQQGWGKFWGYDDLRLSDVSGNAAEGTHALRITVTGSDYVATGVTHPPNLGAGAVVRYAVATDRSVTVSPFVYDSADHPHFGSQMTVSAGAGWTTVTFTVPSVSIHALGLQVRNAGGGTANVTLDAVRW
jgi:hypothetical protein